MLVLLLTEILIKQGRLQVTMMSFPVAKFVEDDARSTHADPSKKQSSGIEETPR